MAKGPLPVDSDLAESIGALKHAFERLRAPSRFGKADPALVAELKSKLRVPRRYRDFLTECDPVDVETRTPTERVRLIAADRLIEEQKGFALDEAGQARSGPSATGWRSTTALPVTTSARRRSSQQRRPSRHPRPFLAGTTLPACPFGGS